MKNVLVFFLVAVLLLSVVTCADKRSELRRLEKEKLKLEIENLKLDNQLKKDSLKK